MNSYLNITNINNQFFISTFIFYQHIYINIKNEHESSCDKFII